MTNTRAEQLKSEGLALLQQGRRREALERLSAAATAFAAQEEPLNQAEMLNNIGVLHRLQGDLGAAQAALEEGGALFAAAGELGRQGQAMANLADVFAARREWTAAAQRYGDSAALIGRAADTAGRAEQTTLRGQQSQVLRALSLHYVRRRNWLAAITTMEQSLAVRPRRGPGGALFYWLLRLAARLMGGGQSGA